MSAHRNIEAFETARPEELPIEEEKDVSASTTPDSSYRVL